MPKLKTKSSAQRRQQRRELMTVTRITECDPSQVSHTSTTMLVTGAAVHQGSSLFSELSRGRQCTPMAYCAIAMSCLVPLSLWNPDLMTVVMRNGDDVYNRTEHREEYFRHTELPTLIEYSGHGAVVSMRTGQTLSGVLDQFTDIGLNTIEQAVRLCKEEYSDGCLFVTCGYTVSLMFHENSIYLFDSHQSDQQGMMTSSGTAVLLKFVSEHTVATHIRNLYAHRLHEQFDCTPVFSRPQFMQHLPELSMSCRQSKLPKESFPSVDSSAMRKSKTAGTERIPQQTDLALEKYFAHQAMKRNLAQSSTHMLKSSREQNRQRKRKFRVNRDISMKIHQAEMDRKMKKEKRHSQNKSERYSNLQKDRIRKRASWANKGSFEKNVLRKMDRLSKKRKRSNEDDAAKKKLLSIDRMRKKESLANKTLCEKKIFRDKDRLVKQRKRSNEDGTKKKKVLSIDRTRKKESLANKTLCEKKIFRDKNRLVKQRKRSNEDGTKKKKVLSIDRARKKESLANKTLCEKKIFRDKDRLVKQRKRSNEDGIRKKKVLSIDRTRKKESLANKTLCEKKIFRDKDRLVKQRKRSNEDGTKKKKVLSIDRTRKKESLANKTLCEKKIFRDKDRLVKQRKRSNEDGTKKKKVLSIDRARKKESLANKTLCEKKIFRDKDRLVKQTKRSNEDGIRKKKVLSIDRTRKKESLANKTLCEKKIFRDKDRLVKQRKRSNEDGTKKKKVLSIDRTRKKESLANKTLCEKKIFRDKDRLVKQRKRSNEDGIRKKKVLSIDRTRKKNHWQTKLFVKRRYSETRIDSLNKGSVPMKMVQKRRVLSIDRTRKKESLANKTLCEKKIFRDKDKLRKKGKRSKKHDSKSVVKSIANFKFVVACGPTFVCCCCHRQLYRRSVVHLNLLCYKKIINISHYLTDKSDWICNTCHQKLKKGFLPCQCIRGNALSLDEIPDVLNRLCPLELQLVAKIIPFMKIVAMPRGAQHGIRGQVVLVPADLTKVTKNLPRPTSSSQIISLVLKRRLSDKHYVHKQYIRPEFVNSALLYLKEHNKCYADVEISSDWQTVSAEKDPQFWNAATVTEGSVNNRSDESSHLNTSETTVDAETTAQASIEVRSSESSLLTKSDKTAASNSSKLSTIETMDSEDEIEMTNPAEFIENLTNQRSINSETCIHPIHGPEIHTNEILNLAPAEGQVPVSITQVPQWEAMAFPKLFPTGQYTFNTDIPRKIKLTAKQYVNARLLSKDPRFAESPEYAFHALDWIEREAVKNSISITTRKMFHEEISVQQLKNPSRVSRLLTENQLFATFKNIQGTPQYFKQMHLDMLAKLRQYGPFTFFISGSAAEFHWPEMIQVVAAQYGQHFTEEQIKEMDWQTKRNWLQRNPVTVARHIDYIFEQLWGKVILSGAHPIGQVLNYDLRKEMQGRGTAHFHSAVHIKQAPRLDIDPDKKFAEFADKHISCAIPEETEDPVLRELVTSRQYHHHTRTCKKNKGVACRFAYPRPPSQSTIVSRVPEGEGVSSLKNSASQMLTQVFEAISKINPYESPPSLEELLSSLGISLQDYNSALQTAHRRTHVVMRRTVRERFINNYNPVLLKCLRANMDMQIITSIWACIAYITSYVCKPEKTMSELMRKASKEAADGSITKRLHHVGNQMRKGREVSHHEAIMRLLSLPFRRSNVPVVFIQTDLKENRTRLLKPKVVLDSMQEEDTDIYMPTIHDKYAARPNTLQGLSLAEFVSNYTTSVKQGDNEVQNEVDEDISDRNIRLINSLGTMRKRRTPQVIRYHNVSRDRDEEAYYHRLLLLYKPWRKEEELKSNISYKQAFQDSKDDILKTINMFEPFYEDVENVLEDFDPDELLPEVWQQVATNFEQDKADERNQECDPDFAILNPDNLQPDMESPASESRREQRSFALTTTFQMPDIDYYQLLRSLNDKQRQLFQFVFNWATNKRLGRSPLPFYIFLSGSGGVGKSHLINAVYQGATRALRCPGQHPDQPTVLLTASTGKAATNINGTTLHSAFSLPVKDNSHKFEYKKPSAEKLNTLRSNYLNLKIIIADEISMFGSKSFEHFNRALQTIFENHNDPFAGMSILAVGDLLQLNPVGDQPVFKPSRSGYEALAGSLWTQLFVLHELTEVVRQKSDPVFANLLSRVRTGTLNDDDTKALRDLENTPTEHFPEDTVHIYLTNKQVASYNEDKMAILPNKLTIKAKDSKRETHTNTVPITITSDNMYKTGGLPSTLTVAKGAKVMLTKNIDLSDHLVNGAVGTLTDYAVDAHNPLSGKLYVKFGSDNVGREARNLSPQHLKDCVPIKATVCTFMLAAECPVPVERTMYPLVLAFAITAHKSQGSTYQHMIGDLTLPGSMKTVQQGQIYTVLSRATSRDGLRLVNFTPEKVKVNVPALNKMERMRRDTSFDWKHPLSLLDSSCIHVGYLNIRSLNLHAADLQCDLEVHNLSVLCLTETHIERTSDKHKLEKFTMYTKCTEHGLAIYSKLKISEYKDDESLEIQIFPKTIDSVSHHSKTLLVAVTYRPPTMRKELFILGLEQFLLSVPQTFHVLIGGDFNLPFDAPCITRLCEQFQLKPIISEATHHLGGNLDLILTTLEAVTSGVLPVPYSDHFLTWVSINF